MKAFVFTSATLGYLPKVRVLAESVKARNPDAVFCLLLGERGPIDSSLPEVDEIITVEELGVSDLPAWTFGHSLVELCTAIKARFLEMLLDRPDCESVFYFDPDMVVLTEFEHLAGRFADGPILLTPHLTTPEESLEAIADNEICALRHGIYNLGFLGVRAGAEGRAFANWWWKRVRHFCQADIAQGLFTDQRWVDLAPGFFEGVTVVRDPTWNVATWNLSRRQVDGDLSEGLTIEGRPLRFYHFSGFDDGSQLAMLDKYGREMKGLYELREWYVERCRQLAGEGWIPPEWSFGRFDNGEPILGVHRRIYRRRPQLRARFPDPFATEDPSRSYYHWFATDPGVVTEIEQDDAARRAEAYREELERIYGSRSWKAVGWLRRVARLGRW